ncbi:MAG: DUF5011 domain-containing protein [Candidatus Hydrogenedentes bacterium]|nr:DUF5011 domain-containing protein [Candidatus Hydrogenedentota bacterium]
MGGTGAAGAAGGSGGNGGQGGYGLPGNLKLQGSIVLAKTNADTGQASTGQIVVDTNIASTNAIHKGQATVISNNSTNFTFYSNYSQPGFNSGRLTTGRAANPAVLMGPNPYWLVDSIMQETPYIGDMLGERASTYGWLKDNYWNKTLTASVGFQAAGVTPIRFKRIADASKNFAGYAQILIVNTGAEDISGVTLKIGDNPAKMLDGVTGPDKVAQEPGLLKAGQTWTIAVPTTVTAGMIQIGFQPTMAVDPAVIDLECTDVFTEEDAITGVTASDRKYGTAPVPFPVESLVMGGYDALNLGVPGDYTLTYDVTDNDGIAAVQVSRLIRVRDTIKPTINGTRNFNAYKQQTVSMAQAMEGVSADDACDLVLPVVTVEAFESTDQSFTTPLAWPLSKPDAVFYPYIYILRYTVMDDSGNLETVLKGLTIVDNPPVVITVAGDDPVVIECPAPYEDAGATAVDEVNPEAPVAIGVTGLPIDTGVPGTYTVTYRAQDPVTLIWTEATRTVEVVDTAAPVIELAGRNPLGWQTGTAFEDPGFTATDVCLGDMTDDVVVGGDVVDADTPGEYTITYTADDGINPATVVERLVIVGDLLTFLNKSDGGQLYNNEPASDPLTLWVEFENGILPSQYQWFMTVDGGDPVPVGDPVPLGQKDNGPVLAELVVDPVDYAAGDYVFNVVVTDATGEIPSEGIAVEIKGHLAITADLEDAMVLPGMTFEWSVGVEGGMGEVNIQWQKDDGSKAFVPVSDGGGIAGSGTDTLTFTNFVNDMAGVYQVEVTDDLEGIIIGPAELTMGSGVPVAGGLGLAALAALAALGGAISIRRRK